MNRRIALAALLLALTAARPAPRAAAPAPLPDVVRVAMVTDQGTIMLDLDATDDPVHGEQEGRFFRGYYDHYCYLPLYVFCGRHLLAAKSLRWSLACSTPTIASAIGGSLAMAGKSAWRASSNLSSTRLAF